MSFLNYVTEKEMAQRIKNVNRYQALRRNFPLNQLSVYKPNLSINNLSAMIRGKTYTNKDREFYNIVQKYNEAKKDYEYYLKKTVKFLMSKGMTLSLNSLQMARNAEAAASNKRINTIPMPNKLKNNKNAITGQRFKYGVPYVEVKSGNNVHYYPKNEFQYWYNLRKKKDREVRNLFTKLPLNKRKIRMVVFEIPLNIQNKANSLQKTRAARIIQTAFRKYRWTLPN